MAALALMMASDVLGGTFSANFNGGLLPAGSRVFNRAVVSVNGGVGGTGCLKLTTAANSLEGAYIIDDFDGGASVYGFRATFMARIGGGTAVPADGWSFNVGPDIGDGSFGEWGAGSGLRFTFDTYDNTDGDPNNGVGEAPAIRLVVGNQTIAATPLLALSDLVNNAFVPVEILVHPDGSLDLTCNGKKLFAKFYFPGYQPLAGSRFAFGARTGGLNANHWIDDLRIDTYLTPEPGIVRDPQSQRILEGSSATFAIALNNADIAAVQWLRDGQPIPGENGLTYTLSGATLADDGAKISASVSVGATILTSAEATLNVVRIELPAVADVSYDFNDALLPADTVVYGAGTASDLVSAWMPYASATGGVGDSGVLQLTESQNGQSGSFIIPDLQAGAPVYGVAARFDVRIGGGSEVPADGMSFNFGPDLPDGTAAEAEEGVGSGLRVCFDIYDNADGNPNNATGEAPAITLKWGTTVVGEVKTALSDITTGDAFADVIVRLTADGLLDVAWNGKVLLYRAPVPGFGSIAGGRFGFFARTGGLNANQWVDNLKIYTYLSAPLRISKQPAPATVLIGKPVSFEVQVNTRDGASYQWYRNDAPIGEATTDTYTLPATSLADDGAKFKVEVKLGTQAILSDGVTLTVVDLAAPVSPKLSYDFNNGLPAGTQIGGNTAFIDGSGGINDSGVLKLTTSANSQTGGFRSGLVESGALLLDFTLAVDVLAGNGTVLPADGFSINLGSDVPITAPGDAENGAGTGLTIAFDTYDNGGGEAPSIDVRYKGQTLTTKLVPLALLNSGAFAQVLLRVTETGNLDLAFGDIVVFHDFQIPGYVPMSGVKAALYARTGGANASYWFDNLRFSYRIPVTISIAEEPADALVLAGQSATFAVQVSNPLLVTFQWRRNNQVIPNANQFTYTTPALNAADEGTGYSVVVSGPGNVVTSRTAIVAVMNRFDAGANPAVNLTFDDGQVPADGLLFGQALIQPSGGVGDSGFLQLTEAVNGQSSSFLFPTPAGVSAINDVTAVWMMRVGGGTDVPADGCSFVLGEDIADATFGEDGAGSGLVVGFDTYDNGTTEIAPEITIRYKSQDVITRSLPISVLRTGAEFLPVGVRVKRNGTLDLYYGNTAVYRGVALPDFTPFGAGRFGWGARTGGLNDNHWVDSITVALNSQTAAGTTLTVTRSGANVVLTWTGGGTLQSTAALPGGWTDIAGATTGFTTPATSAARFYRVRQ